MIAGTVSRHQLDESEIGQWPTDLGDTDGVTLRIEDFLAAPVGVALLDRLEARQRHEFLPFEAFPDCDPSAVDAAAVYLAEATSFGEVLSLGLEAAQFIAGPWSPGAPDSLALAYVLAPARVAIAEVLLERFRADLSRSVDLTIQQWWLSNAEGREPAAAFRDFSRIYGNGEFTWDGVWTVSDPPSEIHDDLISEWEMYPGPISRWRLPVDPSARVWRIDQPSDWVQLVERFPRVASAGHLGWELPGPNQHQREIRNLIAVENQNAVRTGRFRQVLPDWQAVANEYDGVHLSWAGFLTTEGFVSDLTDGRVTMLRYWGSERTLWLRDVFGSPEPFSAPQLSGSISGILGTDASRDEVRSGVDIRWMAVTLGRSLSEASLK